MRRSDREITDLDEILSIINDCKVIHLAMVDDGEPYLLPLNFGYTCEGGAFSFFCHSAREGRKLDILRKNPTVAFEMDCRGALDEHDVACQCGYYFASVTGVGHVEFLDGEEKLVALTSLMRHMAGREDQFTEQQARTVEVLCRSRRQAQRQGKGAAQRAVVMDSKQVFNPKRTCCTGNALSPSN